MRMNKKAKAIIVTITLGILLFAPIVPSHTPNYSKGEVTALDSCISGVPVFEAPFFYLTGIGLQLNPSPHGCGTMFYIF